MNDKIKYLKNKLNSLDIQGMIISNPVNIYYLTGIKSEGTMLITNKEIIYLTDGRYIEEVNTVLTIEDEIIVHDVRSVSECDYENFFVFCNNVGFEEEYVTYKKYKRILEIYKVNNLIETERIIELQRAVKEQEEIENIKQACTITDDCFRYLKKQIKIGMTEEEIAKDIENYFKLRGTEGLAFNTIVASGENSSKPHATPTKRKIAAGDIITIDMGCKYNDYTSDMTRTIFVKYVPDEIKPIYELVLENQKAVLRELKEGTNIKNLSNLVESNFKFKGYSLIHALGHGVGLENHEQPFITFKNLNNLKENMVITIEPGIYIPGKFGVRIEDTVLVTRTGYEVLTMSEKEYVVI